MKFEKNWCEINGQRFLYVRPKVMVTNEDWGGFFEAALADYQNETFLILVDVARVEEDIGFEGFAHITEILKGCNIRRARFAVLPSNAYYPILAELLEKLARTKDLDLEVQLFEKRDAAQAWLGRQ